MPGLRLVRVIAYGGSSGERQYVPGAKGDAFLENVSCAFKLVCLRSLLKKEQLWISTVCVSD